MKNILIICNTYYQVIMASHFANDLLIDSKVSLVISDHSKNAKIYAENARKLAFFENVYYSECRVFDYDSVDNLRKKFKLLLDSFLRLNKGHKALPNMAYDRIFYYNDTMSTRLFVRYQEKLNSNFICCRFEEGILSYNNTISKLEGFRKKRFDLCGLNDIAKLENNMYCTYPELYKGPLETVKIPLMDPNNTEFVNAVSTIFGVEKDKLSYPQKYIFFSSVLDFEGGEPVGELELAKKVAELLGKENLLVKVHPRDDVKRFIEAGLTVDQNSSVPWEAIQLNYDFSKHVFITVCSGSVLSISSVIPNPPRTVFAYKLVNTAGNQCALNTVKTLDEFRSSLGDKIKLDFIEVAEKLEDIVKTVG